MVVVKEKKQKNCGFFIFSLKILFENHWNWMKKLKTNIHSVYHGLFLISFFFFLFFFYFYFLAFCTIEG